MGPLISILAHDGITVLIAKVINKKKERGSMHSFCSYDTAGWDKTFGIEHSLILRLQ